MFLSLAVLTIVAAPIVAIEAACKGLVDGAKLEFTEAIGIKHLVKAGGKLELVCSVLAAPTASIVWLHEGKEVEMYEGPKDHLLTSDKRLGISILEARLVRDCVNAEDAGTYTCVALSPCAKTITQTTNVVVEGKASCSPSTSLSIPLHTYSRMELPTVPLQLVCRSSHPLAGVHWVRVADDDSTSPIGYAASGFLQLPSGDLIVDPLALAADEGEELVSLTMRCISGAVHVDSSIIFMEE